MPGSSSLLVARTLTFFNLLKRIRTVYPLNHISARFAAICPDVQSSVHLSRLLPWQINVTVKFKKWNSIFPFSENTTFLSEKLNLNLFLFAYLIYQSVTISAAAIATTPTACPIAANAILDHLLHHSHVIKIVGPSYRTKDYYELLDAEDQKTDPLKTTFLLRNFSAFQC